MRLLVTTSLLLVALTSCGRTEPLVETIAFMADAGRPDAGRPDAGRSLDAGVADAGVPTSCANAPGPQTAQRCSQQLRVLSLSRSMPSCFVDVRMNVGDEGVLEWDCGTTMGRAEVRFPRARFTGVVRGDLLEVCFGSEFDWTDGCRWTSAQALRGPLTAGATLRLTYSEASQPGQLGCVVPCSASGEVMNLGP